MNEVQFEIIISELEAIKNRLESLITHNKFFLDLKIVAKILDLSYDGAYARMRRANLEPGVECIKLAGRWHISVLALEKVRNL